MLFRVQGATGLCSVRTSVTSAMLAINEEDINGKGNDEMNETPIAVRRALAAVGNKKGEQGQAVIEHTVGPVSHDAGERDETVTLRMICAPKHPLRDSRRMTLTMMIHCHSRIVLVACVVRMFTTRPPVDPPVEGR